MLKSAIYCNVFILLIMSIFFLTRIFMKNSDLKKLRKLIIIYIIFNFISFYLCDSEIVDIGWDFIFLFPIKETNSSLSIFIASSFVLPPRSIP